MAWVLMPILLSIGAVLFRSAPIQILWSDIQLVVITMQAIHALWSWTDKRFRHQNMQLSLPRADPSGGILPCHVDAANALGFNAPDTPYMANHVSCLMPVDGQP